MPRCTHPHIALLIGREYHRHGLGMDWFNHGIRCRCQEAVDIVRPRYRLGLRASVTIVGSPDARKGENGRLSSSANQTTSFFFVSGFGSGAYSAKLFAGTRQRLSGFNQPRQCGDDVLRMLVTGAPAVRGGGGMPQRMVTNSVPLSVLRITGAG